MNYKLIIAWNVHNLCFPSAPPLSYWWQRKRMMADKNYAVKDMNQGYLAGFKAGLKACRQITNT